MVLEHFHSVTGLAHRALCPPGPSVLCPTAGRPPREAGEQRTVGTVHTVHFQSPSEGEARRPRWAAVRDAAWTRRVPGTSISILLAVCPVVGLLGHGVVLSGMFLSHRPTAFHSRCAWCIPTSGIRSSGAALPAPALGISRGRRSVAPAEPCGRWAVPRASIQFPLWAEGCESMG